MGLVESEKLCITVYPLILRGVSIVGIDSAETKMPQRLKIWDKLANDWKPKVLNQIYREVSLPELNDEIDKILRGKQIGKILINLWK